MRKIFAILLCMAPVVAYGEYYDYGTEEQGDCPVCECACDKDTASRDTYAGFRIYKNEHSAFSYSHSGGHKIKGTRDNFGFGTTMGNQLAPYLRVEYETLYMGAEYRKSGRDFEYDIWSNLLNAYLMKNYDGVVAPYIGAGLGLTAIWGEIDGRLDNAFDLSYQAMVGVLFTLNSRIDLDVGFKYVNFGRVEHRHGTTRVDATQLYVGATYKFGL